MLLAARLERPSRETAIQIFDDSFREPLTGSSGSRTVKRTAAPNGGTARDPGRSRIGDRCALISGRSVESHQCRRPGHDRSLRIALDSGQLLIVADAGEALLQA